MKTYTVIINEIQGQMGEHDVATAAMKAKCIKEKTKMRASVDCHSVLYHLTRFSPGEKREQNNIFNEIMIKKFQI